MNKPADESKPSQAEDSSVASTPSHFVVEEAAIGQRLDAFLAAQIPKLSRALVRKAIDLGSAKLDGKPVKGSVKLQLGQRIEFFQPDRPSDAPQAENIPLDILFEDDALIAVNKPPGMVVHPAKGHWSGTLTSALAFHFQSLSGVGGAHRPGIVHRLDRDTSGVILVARTDESHLKLAAQFEARTVSKEYTAFSRGSLDRDRDIVEQPIGPHPYSREKMAIRAGHKSSRDAKTEFKVIDRYRGFLRFLAKPKTGRTHQIRVHLCILVAQLFAIDFMRGTVN